MNIRGWSLQRHSDHARAGGRRDGGFGRTPVGPGPHHRRILSGASDQLPGQKGDSDLAARRVATWCRSCASGNWSLFVRRLERDGLSIEDVLAKFATVRRNATWPTPAWLDDAVWVDEALRSSVDIAAEHPVPGTGPVRSKIC